MNDYLCGEGTCYGVVGGMLAFWDHSHLTNTFASALSPMLERRLENTISKPEMFAAD